MGAEGCRVLTGRSVTRTVACRTVWEFGLRGGAESQRRFGLSCSSLVTIRHPGRRAGVHGAASLVARLFAEGWMPGRARHDVDSVADVSRQRDWIVTSPNVEPPVADRGSAAGGACLRLRASA